MASVVFFTSNILGISAFHHDGGRARQRCALGDIYQLSATDAVEYLIEDEFGSFDARNSSRAITLSFYRCS